MTDYLDKKAKGYDLLRDCEQELCILASAFAETGNTVLAERISMIAKDVANGRNRLDDAFGDLFNTYIGAGREATANMVNAALSVTMAKKK